MEAEGEDEAAAAAGKQDVSFMTAEHAAMRISICARYKTRLDSTTRSLVQHYYGTGTGEIN